MDIIDEYKLHDRMFIAVDCFIFEKYKRLEKEGVKFVWRMTISH